MKFLMKQIYTQGEESSDLSSEDKEIVNDYYENEYDSLEKQNRMRKEK
jgi:hypothetical protein